MVVDAVGESGVTCFDTVAVEALWGEVWVALVADLAGDGDHIFFCLSQPTTLVFRWDYEQRKLKRSHQWQRTCSHQDPPFRHSHRIEHCIAGIHKRHGKCRSHLARNNRLGGL